MIYELMSRETKKDIDKIRVSSAEIVVHGTKEKPYYEIKYFDLSDHKIHIGYSSYKLDVVFGYLEKYFEIVDSKKSNQIEDFCNRDLISRKTVLNYLKEQNANLLMEKQKMDLLYLQNHVGEWRALLTHLEVLFWICRQSLIRKRQSRN